MVRWQAGCLYVFVLLDDRIVDAEKVLADIIERRANEVRQFGIGAEA